MIVQHGEISSFLDGSLSQNTDDKREKIQALSLAKECYSMKLYLLTNATVVDDAIRFVSSNSKENLQSSAEGDKKESNEPDYEDQHWKVSVKELFLYMLTGTSLCPVTMRQYSQIVNSEIIFQ